ncbi:nitroreductase family protein, partial [Myxococcota bacterium]|nr:nitroreductase family protein [Myxococcota bacterium]
MSEFNPLGVEVEARQAAKDTFESPEFAALVHARQSIRLFTDEPIPEEIVRECLDLALLAPTSSNLQPWAFYWVRDPAKVEALRAMCLSQPAATTAQALIVCVARKRLWRQHARELFERFSESGPESVKKYYGTLIPIMMSPGPLNLFGALKRALFFTLGLFRPVPRGPSTASDLRVFAHQSIGFAAQNLMLAFRAKGYDTCPMGGIDPTRIKRLLKLGYGDEVSLVI